jgi:hypothetical protein
MGRSRARVDASEQGTTGEEEEASMTEDRRRCGWGAVVAAVTLFAALVLTVPTGPGLS